MGTGKYENNLINYVLLALACMNFMQSGSIILVLYCVYNFFLVEKYVNRTTALLFVMALSMVPIAVSSGEGALNEAVKTVNYVLPFFIGYNGYNKADNKLLYMRRTLLAMFVGYAGQIAAMYIYNLSFNTDKRLLVSIWTNTRVSVTLIGLLSAYVIGYAFSVIIFDSLKIHKVISVIGMIFVVLINLKTATRTPFVMMIVVAGCFLLVLLSERTSMKKIKYLAIFIFLGICLIVALAFNLFGFRDYILSSNLFERFNEEGMATGRFDISATYFKYMFDYPWGGSNVEKLSGSTAHNIWQQAYDSYGCITGILLLFVTFSLVSQFIKIIRIENKKNIDYTLIGIYFALIVQMGLEPILTGYPIIFWGLLLIHGITIQYYNDRISGNTANSEI